MFPDFSQPMNFLMLFGVIFLFITGRYFLIAGIFYGVFYVWFPKVWQQRKINQRGYKDGQFKKEIGYSMISGCIFSLLGAIAFLLWQKGFTKVYLNLNDYGWWYLPVSLVIYMFLQETYYYWMHRWMHIPTIFRVVHKVHHDSKISSPFTAFSFHPIEALLQAVFLPVLILFIPIHLYVLILLLVIMSFSSVINHLDIELYPATWKNNFAKWLIGATHHSLHHRFYKHNYGLYFTFWDVWEKTESQKFGEIYDRVTKHKPDSVD